MSAVGKLANGAIRLYQLSFAAVLGGHCRYEPTCSHYAHEAIHRHGAARGMLLGLLRILRCGPGGGSGFDPVPGVWQDALPGWIKSIKSRI